MHPLPCQCDVVIIGGGLAGLTLALQLRQNSPQISLVVLEREALPFPQAAHKVGESTVEIAAHYFTNVLGLEKHLKDEQLPKLGLRCFFNSGPERSLNKRLELGSNHFFPRRTFQIDRGRLENHLAEKLGLDFYQQAKVREIKLLGDSGLHSVKIEKEKKFSEIRCRWVIDTSGRASVLKKNLTLSETCKHNINAVWFRINRKINIDDWYSDSEWRSHNQGATSRWFSTNHLLGHGYWVWIIPLSSDATSIGIVADPRQHPLSNFNTFEKAISWLDAHEPRCAQAIRSEKQHLMDFLALKNYSRWCSQLFSSDRWALSGDSGVFLDPLYSPGSDYIALSNTFITDLVIRELSGKKVSALTQVYNDLLLLFAKNSLYLYQDQYAILGNALVMPIKILWDFAVYWTFMAFLFTHNRLCDISLYITTKEKLERISLMNKEMQLFFRSWHQLQSPDVARAFIDIADLPYFYELNKSLTIPLNDQEFKLAFDQRLIKLNELASEIVSRAKSLCPALEMPTFVDKIDNNCAVLEKVFETLSTQDLALAS